MAKHQGNILIVDDDEMILLSAQLLLEQYFTHVVKINNPNQITEALKEHSFSLVLLDMNFKQGETSGAEGIKWLEEIKRISPETNVLLMTAYGEVDIAVEVMKKGALDFIVKPWQNEKLLASVRNGLALTNEQKKVKQLESREKALVSKIDKEYGQLIGSSNQINDIKQLISKVAPTDATILITGENGTGKEVIARTIHQNSDRSKEPFITVDLGSISDTLFESELFGHEKGAFTDAKESRVGRMEAASGGTVFLDEIGNLSLEGQAKLLTVLQHNQITRVGSNIPKPLNVRIICATNSNIKEAVKSGNFREDLYYRINTVELGLPPLKERQKDIEDLANHFFNQFKSRYRKDKMALETDAIKTLKNYSWPGNVRELQHAIERAVILSDADNLSSTDFKFLDRATDSDTSFDDYNLENIEAWAIKKAIQKHQGNISHAAKELGLSRGAMYRRMEKYHL